MPELLIDARAKFNALTFLNMIIKKYSMLRMIVSLPVVRRSENHTKAAKTCSMFQAAHEALISILFSPPTTSSQVLKGLLYALHKQGVTCTIMCCVHHAYFLTFVLAFNKKIMRNLRN